MLTDSDVARAKGLHIPIDSFNPSKYWIVVLDRSSFSPTDEELKKIRSYCESTVRRVYNEAYAERLLAADFPSCGGHNTIVFTKREDGGWAFRRLTWTEGPLFVPSIIEKGYHPHTLDELFARM